MYRESIHSKERGNVVKTTNPEIIKNAINWAMSSPYVHPGDIPKDLEVCENRETKRIERERNPNRNKSDNINRNGILYGIGKGRCEGGIVECGKFLEIYLTEEPYHVGNGVEGQKHEREKSPESAKSIARRVNHRARKQIRRLINTNHLQGMVTLTIAPPSENNNVTYNTVGYELQKDYNYVRRLFKIFVQRVRRRCGDIPYVAVFEQHNSERTQEEKRYTWHIHLAVPVDDGEHEELRACWEYGTTNYQDYRRDKQGKIRDEEIHNPGAYMAEYIGKDGVQFGEDDLVRKRRYTASRNINRPKKVAIDKGLVSGNFLLINYNGKKYRNVHYSSKHVPGTTLFKLSATYKEV